MPPDFREVGAVLDHYDYFDECGNLLYQVTRHAPDPDGRKVFVQWTPAENGRWLSGRKGIRPVLFRLRELLAADASNLVYIVEGEKDALNLAALGLVATTNPYGAGKWSPGYSECLRGRRVVILPDNDEPGRQHAERVAAALNGIADSIRVVHLPSLPPKGDVTDWLDLGGTVDELDRLLAESGDSRAVRVNGNTAVPEVPASSTREQFRTTDLGNAERMISQHGDRLLYVHTWRKWLVWTGTYWRPDSTGEVVRLASKTVRSIYAEAAEVDDVGMRGALVAHAKKSESAQRIEAMVTLARSLGRVAVTHEGLDTGLDLLTVNNGTLDLKTGLLRPHDRADRITHALGIAYDPTAICPRWMAFLDKTFGGDPELISFIQRAVGYSLTGDTSEQAFFLGYGTGRNGKSTFLEILRRLLGTLAVNAQFSTFLQGHRSDGPRTDIARLCGARVVTAAEAEAGQKLSMVTIKQFTGGDTLTARKLYSDEFEFKNQAKIWMACNHQPRVADSDLGTWRRVKMIPFGVTIDEAAADKSLPEKLLAELPGILAWAVRGAVAWREEGLGSCAAVEVATRAYQVEQDAFGRFLDERCMALLEAKVKPSDLVAAYRRWADENGEPELSGAALWSKLQERQGLKVTQAKSNGARWWRGIGLRQVG